MDVSDINISIRLEENGSVWPATTILDKASPDAEDSAMNRIVPGLAFLMLLL